MKTIKRQTILFFLFISIATFGQKIKDVQTVLFDNEYGNANLLVKPLLIDGWATETTKSSGVYAILVCYTYKNQKKAIHQDITYDLVNKGEDVLFLNSGAKKSNIVINKVRFYRRDKLSPSQYPKKSDCF